MRSTSLDEVFLHLGREAEGEERSEDVRGLANKIVAKRLSRRAIEGEAEEHAKRAAQERVRMAIEVSRSTRTTDLQDLEPQFNYQPCRIFFHLFYVSWIYEINNTKNAVYDFPFRYVYLKR